MLSNSAGANGADSAPDSSLALFSSEAFFGRGVEIRRARGALFASGVGVLSGEDTGSSLMLLATNKPAQAAGVEKIQTRESLKSQENTARHTSLETVPP
jgi:hypothetical protein